MGNASKAIAIQNSNARVPEWLRAKPASTGGVAGAGACAAGGVGSAEVRVVHRGGYVDDVLFEVVISEVRGPQGCGGGSGEATCATERSCGTGAVAEGDRG